MPLVLTFAITLLSAALLSKLARRSILSTTVVFLTAGLVAGWVGAVDLRPDDHAVVLLIEVTLFAVLYLDAQNVGLGELRSAWRLPGRALLLGMPLAFVGTAGLAMALTSLDRTQAMILGAVLAPTDPVLASAIVGREGVPLRLRRLLNVESGLNDGLSLPVVLVLLGVAGANEASLPTIGLELLGGVAVGVAVPLATAWLLRVPGLAPAGAYEPLTGFAIGLLVFATAELVNANLFLAAFAAGVTVATAAPEVRGDFERFGELFTELLMLLGMLVFGSLLAQVGIGDLGLGVWLLAVLVLVVVRPAAMELSLLGSRLDRHERLAASWFGPKGFASSLYGLLVLQSGIEGGELVFTIVGVVTGLSVLAHASTDVPIARWFRARERREPPPTEPEGAPAPAAGDDWTGATARTGARTGSGGGALGDDQEPEGDPSA